MTSQYAKAADDTEVAIREGLRLAPEDERDLWEAMLERLLMLRGFQHLDQIVCKSVAGFLTERRSIK